MKIEKNFGQVADCIENNFLGQPSLPPADHPNARQCPQCHQVTWRMTQHCLCCGVDLFAIDHHARREQVLKRRLKFGTICLTLSAALGISSKYLPGEWSKLAIGSAILVMFVAGVIVNR